MTSGRKRKERRLKRQTQSVVSNASGTMSQGNTPQTDGEGPITQYDRRLAHRAIKEGWIKEALWDLDATADDIKKDEAIRGGKTPRVLALGAVLKDLESNDPKVRQATVKNVLAMDSLNVKNRVADKPAASPASAPQTNVNVNVGVSVQQELQTVLTQEPAYLEWRSEQALRQRVDPALVGCNGFAEQILGAPSHSDAQSGGDANDSGG